MGELGMGFFCLGCSLLAWLQLHSPSTSVWHQMYTFIIYWAVMLSIIHYGTKAIKNRITYPRTGFVEYRPWQRRWVPMIAGAAVSALLGTCLILAVRWHWKISIPGSLFGLIVAAPYIRIARTVHWKWAIFCFMVAGAVVIGLLPADLLETIANNTSLTSAIPAKVVGAYWLAFVVYGVVLMISGAISFWLYLRHTQVPTQEGQ